MSPSHRFLRDLTSFTILLALLCTALANAIPAAAQGSLTDPNPSTQNAIAAAAALLRRVINVPYINAGDVINEKSNEMAIFWFGAVSSTSNYADVRVGYNDTTLYLFASIFDRRLWYNKKPTPTTLTKWDALTVYLDTNTSPANLPAVTSYRLVGGFHPGDYDPNYQTAFRGSGSKWVSQAVTFETIPGWRGWSLNDTTDDRGWTIAYRIPFSSLGLNGKPADGTIWKLGIALNDRDSAVLPARYWPEGFSANSPATWGRMRYGLPGYTRPPVPVAGTTTIRNKLNGVKVPDAAVGGTTGMLCPGAASYIWYKWGSANFGKRPDFNIQNQMDVADWPCFAKYYITFPTSSIPAGKTIVSARVILHQFGGAGNSEDPNPANRPKPSLIQVSTVNQVWTDTTLSWNKAPLAYENISQTWVDPGRPNTWPGIPWTWDVSQAAAQAYAAHKSLSLVFYEADFDYHSGKYFVSSETGDWNAEGRPTLIIDWGNP